MNSHVMLLMNSEPNKQVNDNTNDPKETKVNLAFIGATDPAIKAREQAETLRKIDDEWSKTQEWWKNYRRIYCPTQTFTRSA